MNWLGDSFDLGYGISVLKVFRYKVMHLVEYHN